MEASLYPVFLKLRDRSVLVVGGGPVAASRIPPLLSAGARISVVAPELRPEIRKLPVRILERGFAPEDLDGVWLVVSAAIPEVNRAVAAAAEERCIFANVVDDAAAASAYTAGVLRRGGVTIAVSTEGEAPALAGLVREGLEAVLPDEIGSWKDEARRLRDEQRAAGVPMERRRPLLLEALTRLYTSRERRSA